MTFVYSDITACEIHGHTLLREMYINAMAEVMLITPPLSILPRGHSYQSVKLTIHQSTG
jgi:hypothetical protein